MKKIVSVLFIISLLSLCACSKKKETEEISQTQTKTEEQEQIVTVPKVDYDLSNMNYNMLSTITFEMLIEPEKYNNKTVKICGQFYTEVEENVRYYSAITWDATLCCPAGMDFIPPAGMKFPEDFPTEESQITVTGTLHENPEDGNLLFYADTIEF